jgi:protein-S-isoprenylcysteine O-methyltransferase Ste14
VWTPDRLGLAVAFTAYCVAGPLLKESRYVAAHGDAFRAYQARVPYMLPVGARSLLARPPATTDV